VKIVIDDKIPFIKGVFEPYSEVVYMPGKDITAADVKDAAALITRTRTRCDRALLEGSAVRAVATATIGYDHIDTEWCEAAGIAWSNAPGCNSGSVCQYLASCLVSIAKRHALDLERMTLGVVGAGNVGAKVAAAGRALGMRVLVNDPPRERREGPAGFVTLDTIVSEADIITLHVPLTEDGQDATLHLFDAERISKLRSGQWLINSSRGPVVDNAALKTALKAHRIAGAVLDVWEDEPQIDTELLDLLDFATPHIAGYSADGKANGTAASVRFVAEKLGLPLTEWAPASIPLPAKSVNLKIDSSGKDSQSVLTEALLATYEIGADSSALKAAPASFEALRGNYPVRREPHAFTVATDAGPDTVARLRLLGFNISN